MNFSSLLHITSYCFGLITAYLSFTFYTEPYGIFIFTFGGFHLMLIMAVSYVHIEAACQTEIKRTKKIEELQREVDKYKAILSLQTSEDIKQGEIITIERDGKSCKKAI